MSARPDGTVVKASMNGDPGPQADRRRWATATTPRISADGNHVAFVVGGKSNMPKTSADPNFDTDVYVRDLVANTTTLIDNAGGGSTTAAGHQRRRERRGLRVRRHRLWSGATATAASDVFLANSGRSGDPDRPRSPGGDSVPARRRLALSPA